MSNHATLFLVLAMRVRASVFTAQILAVLSLPLSLTAQLTRSLPPGVHHYRVAGTYQGQEMEPWNTQFELRDTTIGGDAWSKLIHYTPRPAQNAEFTFITRWKKANPSVMTVTYENHGREPSDCTLSLAGGKITGTITPALTPTPVDVKGEALPDYAIGTFLSLRTLAEGDTIRITAFRCLPYFQKGAIVTKSFVGVVHGADAPRTVDAKPEPAWVIEGTPGYHMVVKIAKSDRQLLSFTIPEGSVGEQTLGYAGTKSNSAVP